MTLSAQAHEDTRLRRRLGTMHDVRRILPLPRSTIYEYAQAGKVPGVVRVGRRLLFDLDVIDDWIDAGGGTAQELQ